MHNANPKVALVSLGCPKNLVDSEKMLAVLAEGGCVVGAPMEDADVIVVNTCGFLSSAKEESLGVIREALGLKEGGRTRRVVVAGCLVNRDAQKLFDIVPGIDAIVGVNDRDSILAAVLGRRRMAKAHAYAGGIASDAGRFRLTPRHTAYLRIAEGCSQRCTFCTIPAIRGPFRSKPVDQIVAEAQELIADGAVELNLIAQDTTNFGRDIEGGDNLASLLRRLDTLDGVQWIRLMYAYPRRFTDGLVETISECRHVLPYVDMPLQHISDGVLRRMGRCVTRAATEKLLARMRARIKGLVLRTAFIVGFPGETEAQFNELLQFVKDFRFDALGVFEFSPEDGAPAARLPRAVAPQTKADRARQIMLAQRKIAFAANRRKVGKTLQVLVDGPAAGGGVAARYYGQAPDVDSVCLLTKRRRQGQLLSARVVGTRQYDLIVEPL